MWLWSAWNWAAQGIRVHLKNTSEGAVRPAWGERTGAELLSEPAKHLAFIIHFKHFKSFFSSRKHWGWCRSYPRSEWRKIPACCTCSQPSSTSTCTIQEKSTRWQVQPSPRLNLSLPDCSELVSVSFPHACELHNLSLTVHLEFLSLKKHFMYSIFFWDQGFFSTSVLCFPQIYWKRHECFLVIDLRESFMKYSDVIQRRVDWF